MRIGIVGTGVVGATIGSKLAADGHEVKMGAREASNPKAAAWAQSAGPNASSGTFADAAAFGQIVFNCTRGDASIAALDAAGAANLKGRILVDVANPLDFSKGMPPRLFVVNDDSLGEQIQRRFPETRVVKALNTMSSLVMTSPQKLKGDSDVFLCGNDADAKAKVAGLLREWGWKTIHDLGDISMARGTEAVLPLWVRLWGAIGTAEFNFHIVR